jgi:predicted nuclease with TOPRIM domain
VLFIYMPFYLDKKNLDDCLQSFKNFKLEQTDLKEGMKKAREQNKNLMKSDTELKKHLEEAKKEIDLLKAQQQILVEENQKLAAEKKIIEDENKRYKMRDSLDDNNSNLAKKL